MPAAIAHLLLPGAAWLPPAGPPAPTTAPPNLRALLERLAPEGEDIVCDENGPSPPHEIALARLRGLPDAPGRIPWAAFDNGLLGQPCAWVHPCHWRLGLSEVRLDDPQELALNEAESRALLASAAPYFAQDGLALHWRRPDAWLAVGEPLRGLCARSLARAVGRVLHPGALPENAPPAGAALRRLQNEMQMLFHDHPVNQAREAARRTVVNSLWFSGAGVLEQPPAASAPGLQVDARLLPSALRHDAAAHARAWQAVDAERCAPLRALLRQGAPVRLTLCGERRARSYAPPAAVLSPWRRMKWVFGPKSMANDLQTL